MGKIADVQEVTLKKLVPYERNAKLHSEEQIREIADSISEFGFINPILIDKDFNVIAGHGRIEAAKKLKLEVVPCVFVEGLTDEQRRAFILADNKLFELGSWNDINLETEVENVSFDFESFNIGSDEEKDEEPKKIVCPRCGKEVRAE